MATVAGNPAAILAPGNGRRQWGGLGVWADRRAKNAAKALSREAFWRYF